MSEPIKVTRAQWDAALGRHAPSCGCVMECKLLSGDRDTCVCEEAVARILGERPAPDTPPVLSGGWGWIAQADNDPTSVWVEVEGAEQLRLLLPWVRDHLLPWLEANVEEANDA